MRDRGTPGIPIAVRGQTRTFLDSGVLIAAYKGLPSVGDPAGLILEDPDRIFLSSPFVRHEVSPKALFNNQALEYRFYQGYFRRAFFCDDLKAILSHARQRIHEVRRRAHGFLAHCCCALAGRR